MSRRRHDAGGGARGWIGILAVIGLTMGVDARADPSATLVEQKMKLLSHLLESENARRRTTGPRLEQVRALFDQARVARDKDNLSAAAELLDHAMQALSQVVRQRGADRAAARASARKRQYSDLLASIRTLRSTVDEGLQTADHNASLRGALARVGELEIQAESLVSEGRIGPAMRLLKEAYRVAVLAVSNARNRQTVTYDLNFATPADEYDYERARNQSFETLIHMQSQERSFPERSLKTVKSLVAANRVLRGQAENRARRGNFVGAIKVIGHGSRQLIRALRMLGMPVPG